MCSLHYTYVTSFSQFVLSLLSLFISPILLLLLLLNGIASHIRRDHHSSVIRIRCPCLGLSCCCTLSLIVLNSGKLKTFSAWQSNCVYTNGEPYSESHLLSEKKEVKNYQNQVQHRAWRVIPTKRTVWTCKMLPCSTTDMKMIYDAR